MKIVYVIDSLASKGGAERIIINKMEYLKNKFGYDISIIACNQEESTPNAYPLSTDIHQFCLGVQFYSQYNYRYPYRLWVKRKINKQLKESLTQRVQAIDPDILIGVSFYNGDLVSSIKCRANKLIEVHEPRPFTLSDSGLYRGFLARQYMKYYRNRYFQTIEKNADVVVTLTPGDAKEWHKSRRVVIIPNFTVMPVNSLSDGSAKRVIGVGRLEWVKGYDRLLDAWKIVSDKHPDWHLDIFGTGTFEEELKQQQAKLGLKDKMTFHPATPNINVEYSASSIFAGASHFEGFPLVLLEAMQVGLPCVSFDCPFGPSAVINDGENGFLVPDGDIQLLAKKICQLIEDPEMRQRFSQSAIERSKDFSVDIVMQKWRNLFEELTKIPNK